MASSYDNNSVFLLLCLCLSFSTIAFGGNFYNDFNILFGDGRANIQKGGNIMSLKMDKYTGSGIGSKNEYLFGRFDMQIKLVPGNSAGVVTAFYLSSRGAQHDEIDIEFLGNMSGQPYTLSTNIYANGQGNRELQYHLWFDPTQNFHTYSIDWNPQRIMILVDNIPIRVSPNKGGAFPTKQPMRLYATHWNGEAWATQGGRVKVDWSKAPFTAWFRNFNAYACIPTQSNKCLGFNGGKNRGLNAATRKKLSQIHAKWAIYDYCQDYKRFGKALPLECRRTHRRLAL